MRKNQILCRKSLQKVLLVWVGFLFLVNCKQESNDGLNPAEIKPVGSVVALRVFHNASFQPILLNINTGRKVHFPESEFTGKGSDHWSFRRDGQEAVRIDAKKNVSIFSVEPVRKIGGFSLSEMTNTMYPDVFSEPIVSPNGQFLMTYWRPDYRGDEYLFVVWDRNGKVITEGSPFDYDSQYYSSAFNWTTDNKAIYIAGNEIIRFDPIGGIHMKIGRLALPRGVESKNGHSLSISEDNKTIAIALPTLVTTDNGEYQQFDRMVYLFDMNGSNARLLTWPSDRIRNGRGDFDVLNPVWSPDQKMLAVIPTSSADGCPRVKLLHLNEGKPIKIDHIYDSSENYLKFFRDGRPEEVQACSIFGWW